MPYFIMSSVMVLFTIIFTVSVNPAFADDSVTITTASGNLSVPGCEETSVGCYTPDTVTVDVGGKVTMTNTDSTGIHTFTAGTVGSFIPTPSGVFDSGILNAENSFEYTADTVVEIPYYYMLHTWMQGVIIVQEANADESMKKEMTALEIMTIGTVDVSMSSPVEGSNDAPITIIEFGDYQCPKCDQWFQNEKPSITQNYINNNMAKLYFVDFPFLGNDSDVAANASYCANDQEKFWEYHSTLYNNQGGINEGWANVDALKQFAIDLNLDTEKFNTCVDSNKHADRVSYNKQVGISHGVEGTPVFIIVGSDGTSERIEGPQSSQIFADIIDSMLVKSMEKAMAETPKTEMAETVDESKGGGCLIATAAYGTELASQVQFLREIRDNTIMSTSSGTAFMTGFNQLYYSFSPTIADMERENPIFQEVVRAFITPMISTLSIMTLADNGSEVEVIGLGISIIALNIGMYVAAPVAIGFTLSKRLKSRK